LLFQDRNANLSAYHGTVFEAELDDIVDMVISTNVPVGHPLHKHHESFWIVGSGPTVNGSVPFNDTVQGLQVVPQDFNFDNPPLRDVAFLHGADSYLVLRWRVQFPTATLFHCHIEHHIASGMGECS
jgi:FtsP/CotA-like multicopper oxidase with cupredoxin domain